MQLTVYVLLDCYSLEGKDSTAAGKQLLHRKTRDSSGACENRGGEDGEVEGADTGRPASRLRNCRFPGIS